VHAECEFEFDPAKSAANLVKHGIDFTAAQPIWRDMDLPRRTRPDHHAEKLDRSDPPAA